MWSVPGDIGRRYAAVSGDRNPIHLHRLTALPFGLSRPIAHGMWLKARCLAALEPSLRPPHTVDVEFKLPLFVPARVTFTTRRDGAERRFEVRDAKGEKPHLTGRVRPASSGAEADPPEDLESDPAYSPDDPELRRVKGG